MRSGLKLALAFAMAGTIAACAGDEPETATYGTEEGAEPAAETGRLGEAPADNPILTASFEPAGETTEPISGMVRVFPGDDAGAFAPATETGTETATEAGEETGEEAGAAGETVSATTTGTEQGFRLEVEIDGLSQGEHAWHIHDGPCGEQAPVIVAITETSDEEGIGEALSAGGEGQTARADVTVPGDQLTLQQLQSGQYSLHVHAQAGTDHGPTTACADLSGPSNPAM